MYACMYSACMKKVNVCMLPTNCTMAHITLVVADRLVQYMTFPVLQRQIPRSESQRHCFLDDAVVALHLPIPSGVVSSRSAAGDPLACKKGFELN